MGGDDSMKRTRIGALAALLVLITATPVGAARPSDCSLQLDVDPVHAYGDTVVSTCPD